MTAEHNLCPQVDEKGRLILPPELASRYGLKPGAQLHLKELENGLYLERPATQLAKLYIEPTNLCNLNCRTCVRNIWEEPMGMMSDRIFDRVVEGVRSFSPLPRFFFGGSGEPLLHPKIVEMVTRAKALGVSVELITNGTLLTADLLQGLVATGMDVLWVSIDGATPESYADVRLGAELPRVLENLAYFRRARFPLGIPQTQLGIVFVAMKRNIADLPAVRDIAWRLGAKRLLVTNVLPYTSDLRDEVLYSYRLQETCHFALRQAVIMQSFRTPRVNLPRVDLDEKTRAPIFSLMSRDTSVNWDAVSSIGGGNRCPFVESGAGAVSWDGGVSPCLPLLHDCVSFLNDRERCSRHWSIGNVTEQSLADLWNTPEHLAFRWRVQAFDFPPCVLCGGCDLLDANEKDCFGNEFPTCGACLWAQGLIQCP